MSEEINEISSKNLLKKDRKWNSKKTIILITIIIFVVFLVLEIIRLCCFSNSTTTGDNINETIDGFCETCGLDELLQDVVESKSLLEQIAESLQDKFYINSLVSILCPVISTILSISVSVYSDKICGLSLADLRKLDEKNRFSLVEMLLIPIIILVLCVVLFYCNFWITAFGLNIISFIYVVYFICQEVPILAKSDKAIRKIVLKPINSFLDNNITNNKSNKLDSTAQTINALLMNMVYMQGLRKTYEYIGRIDFNTLCTLLEISNTRIEESRYGTLIEDPYNAYNTHISNIKSFLNLLESEVKISSDYSEANIRALSNAIYDVGKALGDEELLRTYHEDMLVIVNQLGCRIKESDADPLKNKYLVDVANYLLIKTLSDKSIWYVEVLFDAYFESDKRNARYDNYLIFVTLYLYYMGKRNQQSLDFVRKIDSFINQNIKNFVLEKMCIFGKSELNRYGLLLNSLLSNFKTTAAKNKLIWSPISTRVENVRPFDEEYIIAWFTNFLNVRYSGLDTKLYNSFRRSLSGSNDDFKIFADFYRHFTKVEERNNFEDIISEVNGYCDAYSLTKSTIDSFIQLNQKKNKKVDGSASIYFNDTENISSNQKYDVDGYLNKINDVITEFVFYSNFSEDDIKHSGDELTFLSPSIYSKVELDQFVNDFDLRLRGEIISIFDSDTNGGKTIPTDFDFDYFNDFVKTYTSNSKVQSLLYQELKKRHGKVYLYNEGSIKFYAKIDPASICRYLTGEEIEQVISKEYENINGVYKRIKFNKYDDNNLYPSKNSLINYIYDNYRYFAFYLDYRLYYDKENMFSIQNDDSKD